MCFIDKARVTNMKLNLIFPSRLNFVISKLMDLKKRLIPLTLEWLGERFTHFWSTTQL